MATLNEMGKVSRGKSRHRPRNDERLYGGQYPFIQTGDIKSSELHVFKHTQTYNEIGLQQSKLWSKGTLCITIAANIAETAILTYDACFPDSIAGFVSDTKKSDVYYVKYYIDYLKLKMQQISKGTTQDNLSVDKLLSFDFGELDVGCQRKISQILLNYDHLIENNNRRIAILEEMAQKLYREWFVHFRFPGHENVKMVESEVGLIPKGWSLENLGTIVNNFDSQRRPISTLKRRNMQGEYPYYGAAKVIDYVNNYLFDDKFLLMAEDGSVITTKNTPMLQYVKGKMWVNNHTHILQGKVVSTEYLFLVLSCLDIRGYITGAAQPKITQENMNRIPVLVPSTDVIKQFDSYVQKVFDQRIMLERKNTNLRKTRDLLLPRLISGDIDVSELDIPIKSS